MKTLSMGIYNIHVSLTHADARSIAEGQEDALANELVMGPVVKAFRLKSFRIRKILGIVMELVVGYHNGNTLLHLNASVLIQLNVCGMRANLCVLRNQVTQTQGLYEDRIINRMLDNAKRVLTIDDLLQIG